MAECLYEVLGVDRHADSQAIKDAYKARAKELHPDAGGTEEAFQALGMAYKTLLDEDSRAHYDSTGCIPESGGDEKAAALNIIDSILTKIITHEEDILACDMTHVIKKALREHIRQTDRDVAFARKCGFRAERMLGRFQRTDGKPNHLESLITRQIELARRVVESKQRSIKIHQIALDIMDEYEFTPEFWA